MQHGYYFEIILLGSIVGMIMGYATQRYPQRPHRQPRHAKKSLNASRQECRVKLHGSKRAPAGGRDEPHETHAGPCRGRRARLMDGLSGFFSVAGAGDGKRHYVFAS